MRAISLPIAVTLALAAAQARPATITVTSTAFKDNQPIPLAYTGYGDYRSPPLTWSGAPAGTKELALIVDDPDVPMDAFATHWLLYNIPPAAKGVPADLPGTATHDRPAALKGATQGLNALKRLGFLPPKPFAGSGLHHYRFTVYALDADLPLAQGLTKDQLTAAMKGHIIGQGTLVGLFERKAP